MTAETNRSVLRQMLACLDQADWSVFDVHPGLYETRQHFPHLHAAFPDLHHTIETELVDDEMIACVATAQGTHLGPFMGIAPTGKAVRFMVLFIERITDGKIVQHWALADFLSLFEQVGAIIQPATSASASSQRSPEEKQ